jgi:hypothetical protein
MEYPAIKYLYKFYSYNVHSLSVLINNKVRFSKPEALNDPFDIDIDFISPISPDNFVYKMKVLKNNGMISKEQFEDYEKYIPDHEALNEISEIMNEKFRDDIKKWGVFCMCEHPKNILMWSHYADHHKGFCVKFIRNEKSQLGDIEKTRPVNYSCKYPSPDPFSENGMEKLFDELFFTKAKNWEYEKEWRMLNEEGGIELLVPGKITAIIFGLKMPVQERETIKNILSHRKNISFLKTIKVKNRYELEIVEVK